MNRNEILRQYLANQAPEDAAENAHLLEDDGLAYSLRMERDIEKTEASSTATPASKPSKWRNVKTEVDGIVFDSKREAGRYTELKLLEIGGQITHLELQPEFILQPAFTDCTGKRQRAIKYRADFRYMENEQSVIEDAKGALTPMFRLKRKLFMYKFGMEIRLT